LFIAKEIKSEFEDMKVVTATEVDVPAWRLVWAGKTFPYDQELERTRTSKLGLSI
jgi:hypothetical protein